MTFFRLVLVAPLGTKSRGRVSYWRVVLRDKGIISNDSDIVSVIAVIVCLFKFAK